MKFARILHNGTPREGLVQDGQITLLEGSILGRYQVTDTHLPLKGQTLLAPVLPSKVVCVGLNYRDHVAEMKEETPSAPVIFIKPSTSVIGPGDEIVRPSQSAQVDYEAELAIVVKKKAKNVAAADAGDYILGYTCANDVTARDLQSLDGQWTRAKSFDTFCPIGPVVTDEVDPDNLKLCLLLNGEVKQQSATSCFIHKAHQLFSFISSVMTLLPGDVISTGTPSGIGPMAKGDLVEVQIEGIGTLANTVR